MAVEIYNGGMRRHMCSTELVEEFSELGEYDIISDAAAQTIASWWHSPRRTWTAALSTAGIVSSETDIDDFADPEEYDNCEGWDKKFLDGLRVYIQHKKSEFLTNNPRLCPMCFELPRKNLGTLDYRLEFQRVECEHCLEDLKREWNGFRWSGWDLDL